MTPSPRSELAQQRRRTAKLPHELMRPFLTILSRGGPTAATLAYGWLMDGVTRARSGLYLPAASSAPRQRGDDDNLKWTQTDDEFGRWRRELTEAGSSVRAVLVARITACVAAEGDPLARLDPPGHLADERVAC